MNQEIWAIIAAVSFMSMVGAGSAIALPLFARHAIRKRRA
jgi:hypothetical protein